MNLSSSAFFNIVAFDYAILKIKNRADRRSARFIFMLNARDYAVLRIPAAIPAMVNINASSSSEDGFSV